eukprot:XP_001699144.1 predicted protein [Chlamydomonas reinhardtii]
MALPQAPSECRELAYGGNSFKAGGHKHTDVPVCGAKRLAGQSCGSVTMHERHEASRSLDLYRCFAGLMRRFRCCWRIGEVMGLGVEVPLSHLDASSVRAAGLLAGDPFPVAAGVQQGCTHCRDEDHGACIRAWCRNEPGVC